MQTVLWKLLAMETKLIISEDVKFWCLEKATKCCISDDGVIRIFT